MPAPKRISSSGPSKRSGSSRPPRARAAEEHVDRGGARCAGAWSAGGRRGSVRMSSTCAQTKARSSASVSEPAPKRPGERVGHGRPARRPLVETERDPGRVPEQQRRDDPGDHRQDQVGLAQVAALESRGPLELADRPPRRSPRPARARRRRQRAARTSPGGRATGAWRGGPPRRSSPSRSSGGGRGTPRRSRRASGPGRAAGRACAGRARSRPRCGRAAAGRRSARRLAHPHEVDDQPRPPCEQVGGDGERRRERERSDQDVYGERAFRSSAVIAGTISVRSPITA